MNFYNVQTSVDRRAVVDSLLAAPTLRHIAWHAACVLTQQEGGTQGAYFNVAIQEDV